MNRWEKLTPATPIHGAPVLPWPQGHPPPILPVGKAAVAVHLRTKAYDNSRTVPAKAVGLDGEPMWHGLGRMVILADPGDHLVSVYGESGTESIRLVHLTAGKITELRYRMPRFGSGHHGVLTTTRSHRRVGLGLWAAGIAYLFLFTSYWWGQPLMDFSPLLAMGTAAGGMAGSALLASRVKRLIDQRYRVAMSTEALADPRTADMGMFLADAPCPPAVVDDAHGALLIVAKDKLDQALLVQDANAWTRWPLLTIDGQPRPLSWRTWCYRLPHGTHQVTLTLLPPPTTADDASIQVPDTPITTPVTILPGHVTRLDLTAHFRISVRAFSRDPQVPTEITSYEAHATTQVRSPTRIRR